MDQLLKAGGLLNILGIILALTGALAENAVTPKKDACNEQLTLCQLREPRQPLAPGRDADRGVCGTDGLTYDSQCQLIKVQCRGRNVALKHKGPCQKSGRACFESRRYAMGKSDFFVPKCRRDGSYAPVQCHRDSGCWCVTNEGVSVEGSSVRSGRPKCRQAGKSARRRSSSRGTRQRMDCSPSDKVMFFKNLTSTFASEYERSASASQISGPEKNILVLKWKFVNLDADNSQILEKPEYRNLRRLVKKIVEPKRCAKNFPRVCDKDLNEKITRYEWIDCLTYDGVNAKGADEGPSADVANEEPPNQEADYEEEDLGQAGGGKSDARSPMHPFQPRLVIQRTKPALLLQGSLTRVHLPDLDDPSERNKDDSESNDCLSDRKCVLDEQKNGDTILYVPECTLDGRYQKVQCYRSTGYCWCVHEDTGKPIPGTSVKDQHPKCDALPVPNRPMKGCPEQRKSAFLRDLMVYLENQMKGGLNGSGSFGSPDMSKWHASKEEQIATWSFVMLDKNKNKVLEKREWKTFRALMLPVQNLRRCGKKLPRYCDINHDRKISITEWLNCLNAKRGVVAESTSPRPAVAAKKLIGRNPLDQLLKSD